MEKLLILGRYTTDNDKLQICGLFMIELLFLLSTTYSHFIQTDRQDKTDQFCGFCYHPILLQLSSVRPNGSWLNE